MRYPYFDILINMAKANVSDTPEFSLHFSRDNIRNTKYGPTLESKTFYTTPAGMAKITAINRGDLR